MEKAGPVAAIEAVFHQSGYLAMLETARTPEAAGRVENVRELLVVAAEAENGASRCPICWTRPR